MTPALRTGISSLPASGQPGAPAASPAVSAASATASRLARQHQERAQGAAPRRSSGCTGPSATAWTACRSGVGSRAAFALHTGGERLPADTALTSTTFTIFEGTSEIRRMITGRAVTGLDLR